MKSIKLETSKEIKLHLKKCFPTLNIKSVIKKILFKRGFSYTDGFRVEIILDLESGAGLYFSTNKTNKQEAINELTKYIKYHFNI